MSGFQPTIKEGRMSKYSNNHRRVIIVVALTVGALVLSA